MKISRFEWDARNIGHIARHRVTPDEAEEAFDNEPLFLKGRHGTRVVLGRTEAGRHLTVIYVKKPGNVVRVVTARNMDRRERRRYHRERGK